MKRNKIKVLKEMKKYFSEMKETYERMLTYVETELAKEIIKKGRKKK